MDSLNLSLTFVSKSVFLSLFAAVFVLFLAVSNEFISSVLVPSAISVF